MRIALDLPATSHPDRSAAPLCARLLGMVRRGTPERRRGKPIWHDVHFPAYRAYEQQRVDVNNALMALLAGSQLASHLLLLTEGSKSLLADLYPKVEHIERFSLTSEYARTILGNAEQHLCSMGIPYALAIHEDFLKTCLVMLAEEGLCTRSVADETKLAGQHRAIATATGGSFDPDTEAVLNTLRRMRNCVIHAGGVADRTLINDLASWSPSVAARWLKLAENDPRTLREGDKVNFTHGELILTVAITKDLAREANVLLQPCLARWRWADMVVLDLLTQDPGALFRPDASRKARVRARQDYGSLELTQDELNASLARSLAKRGPNKGARSKAAQDAKRLQEEARELQSSMRESPATNQFTAAVDSDN